MTTRRSVKQASPDVTNSTGSISKIKPREPKIRPEDIPIYTRSVPSPTDEALENALPPALFAPQSVNLLFGSTRVGKTTLLLAMLDQYLSDAGSPFLGYPLPAGSVPAQCGAIIATRDTASYRRKINQMVLPAISDHWHFPIAEWNPVGVDIVAELIAHWARLSEECERPVEFLVVEHLQGLLDSVGGSRNSPNDVRNFYRQLREFARDKNVTILGTAGCPKLKAVDRFQQSPDRIYGSTEWGAQTDTLISIDQLDVRKDEELRRTPRRVYIADHALPSDAVENRSRAVLTWVDFNDEGKLVVVGDPDAWGGAEESRVSPMEATLDQILMQDDPGSVRTKPEWVLLAEQAGISERTCENWLSSRSDPEMGMLERVPMTRPRQYRKPGPGDTADAAGTTSAT
jgi:hypothetical protein